MTYFCIDSDNNITAQNTVPEVQAGVINFASEKRFAEITAEWPTSRLVETWNGFAGVVPFDDLKPVKKFTDRKSAVARIWKAIQKFAPPVDGQEQAPAPESVQEPAKLAKKAKSSKKAAAPKAGKPKKAAAPSGEKPATREGTAKAKVIDMLQQKGGTTLDEIMKATGWQAHTVRGFISVLPKKTGLVITSSRRESDKARVYAAAQ